MYQIVLTENRKKIKVLHTYTREHDALYRFERIKNKEVFFPKKVIYRDKKLVEVKYEVLLLKRKEEGDKDIVIRDEYGRLMEDYYEDKGWTILGKLDYYEEEQFSVTGANRKLNLKEIIDHVLLSHLEESKSKQVVIVNNKIVIEGLTLNMVTCKNKDESIRLYNELRVHCFENKLQNILFFGTVDKKDRKSWYKKIHERTGVGYNRLYRSSSR